MQNHRTKIQAALILTLSIILIGCAVPEDTTIGPPLPLGTSPLAAPLADNAVYFFSDANFRGQATRLDNITAVATGAPSELPARQGISSLRWNLTPGMLVILFERPGGQGDQIPLWGKGEVNSLSQWQANDKISQFAWYNLTAPGELPRPLGAMPTATMPVGTLELYRDNDFKGTLTSVGPVGQFPAGTLHKTGAAGDQMSSLRWNLPPGTVVVLCEDAQGKGRQLTLFGSGQYTSVTPWNFNDKVSRWAWYDLGAAGRVGG